MGFRSRLYSPGSVPPVIPEPGPGLEPGGSLALRAPVFGAHPWRTSIWVGWVLLLGVVGLMPIPGSRILGTSVWVAMNGLVLIRGLLGCVFRPRSWWGGNACPSVDGPSGPPYWGYCCSVPGCNRSLLPVQASTLLSETQFLNASNPSRFHLLSADRATVGGKSLQVGISVRVGEAVVGLVGNPERPVNFTALGHAVVVAARLQTQDAGGEVVVTHEVFQEVGTAFEMTPRPAVRVKGITEPVQPYLVVERNRPDGPPAGAVGS